MLTRCGAKNTHKCAQRLAKAFSSAGPSASSSLDLGRDSNAYASLLPTTECLLHSRSSVKKLPRPTTNLNLAARSYSTEAGPSTSEGAKTLDKPGALFDKSANPWDHVFAGIEDMPPLDPAQAQLVPSRLPGLPRTNVIPRQQRIARRQDMNHREIEAFQGMFDMIFGAVAEQERTGDGARPRVPDLAAIFAMGAGTGADAGRDPLSAAGIGARPDGTSSIGDIMSKMRRHSRTAAQWGALEDAALEQKKAQIELCATDRELLEWAMREVFGESIRYEEEARRAVMRSEATAGGESNSIVSSSNKTTVSESDTPSNNNGVSQHPLQPLAFPFLLAELMRTFRDKFRDPHLALSLFAYARTRSIASYVFGCTTPAYNELLRTRWACFHDLRGVDDALREMHANGVPPDSHTRLLVEEVRREVGLRTVWQEERSLGTGEVFEMLGRIERYVKFDTSEGRNAVRHVQKKGKKKSWKNSSERWKVDRNFEKSSEWKFNDWRMNAERSSERSRYRTGSHEQPAFT